ncbi:hypothetical protein [Anaeromonas frigoriresistens]|nr:hypothetical protein [Anaeromonas frigoriresistens]
MKKKEKIAGVILVIGELYIEYSNKLESNKKKIGTNNEMLDCSK